MVDKEQGIELLHELINHPLPYPRIKELAEMVIKACSQPIEEQEMEPLKMVIDG